MKKCPRCNYDVKDEDKYCPHCGLDLQRKYRPIHGSNQKKRKFPTVLLLYGALLLAFVSIPLLYSQMFSKLDGELNTVQEAHVQLPAITEKEPTLVIQSLDTLADYNEKFSNVSQYITNIQDYEKSLSEKVNTTFDKKYNILILDNYNVLYKLEYTAEISNQYEVVIVKEFDRAHTYNNETTTLKKKNAQSFEELLFNDDEKALMNSFIDDQSSIDKLIEEFSLRKDEFNSKKKTLGHYGLGTYHNQASFVVYRYNDTYQSVLKYTKEVKEYLG